MDTSAFYGVNLRYGPVTRSSTGDDQIVLATNDQLKGVALAKGLKEHKRVGAYASGAEDNGTKAAATAEGDISDAVIAGGNNKKGDGGGESASATANAEAYGGHSMFVTGIGGDVIATTTGVRYEALAVGGNGGSNPGNVEDGRGGRGGDANASGIKLAQARGGDGGGSTFGGGDAKGVRGGNGVATADQAIARGGVGGPVNIGRGGVGGDAKAKAPVSPKVPGIAIAIGGLGGKATNHGDGGTGGRAEALCLPDGAIAMGGKGGTGKGMGSKGGTGGAALANKGIATPGGGGDGIDGATMGDPGKKEGPP